jgi:hypothetical protein
MIKLTKPYIQPRNLTSRFLYRHPVGIVFIFIPVLWLALLSIWFFTLLGI